MSNQIKFIILFWSQFSKNCQEPIKFILSLKLPIKLINLDDPEIREQALNGGDKISVKSVPSLLVEFIDGTINMYNGKDKIMAWLKAMMERKQQSSQRIDQRHGVPHKQFIPDEKLLYPQPQVYDDVHKPPVKVEKVKKKKKGHKAPKIHLPRNVVEPIPYMDDNFDEGGTELIFEDTPIDSILPQNHPSGDIHIPQGKIGHRPSPPTGLATGPSARKGNESLMASMKKMMAEREATLGYGSDKFG